jgi:hypothetical protein
VPAASKAFSAFSAGILRFTMASKERGQETRAHCQSNSTKMEEL